MSAITIHDGGTEVVEGEGVAAVVSTGEGEGSEARGKDEGVGLPPPPAEGDGGSTMVGVGVDDCPSTAADERSGEEGAVKWRVAAVEVPPPLPLSTPLKLTLPPPPVLLLLLAVGVECGGGSVRRRLWEEWGRETWGKVRKEARREEAEAVWR